MAVLPYRKNQYRPHLIRRHGLALVVAVVVVLLGGYNLANTGSVLGDRAVITPAGLLDDTNEYREANGDQPLVLNESLTKAAQLKVNDMFAKQYWAHVAPDGTQPWEWLDDVGYAYLEAGENLARDFTTDKAVVAAWMNSEAHRANVLKPSYTEVGFATKTGEIDGKKTQLVVALYGDPAQPEVAGVTHASEFKDASVGTGSLMTRLGYTLQSLSPAVLASFLLLLVTAMVAFVAHAYRKQLPKPLQRSWYRHHALYKGIGASLLVVVILTLYSGGQI